MVRHKSRFGEGKYNNYEYKDLMIFLLLDLNSMIKRILLMIGDTMESLKMLFLRLNA